VSRSPHRQTLPHAAGVVIPLFALRGAHDVGTGEILDLLDAVEWLASWQHSVLQLLPIYEAQPDQCSPYDALSAFAIDPTYVSTSHVVDVQRSAAAHAWLSSAAVAAQLLEARTAPGRQRRIAYDVKLRLLELGYETFAASQSEPRARRFDSFCRRNAWWLDDYALFRALKEEYGWASWETWPAPLRERQPQALTEVAQRLRTRIRFCMYVQWIAAEQWATVRSAARARGVLLKGDLPFVCARDSADVWAQQDLFDFSGSAGAPPDAFSASGQAWGLPLYDWDAHRRSGYAWWRRRARHARELYDMFRVDHVVGLYRTYSLPLREGGTAGFVPPEEAAQRTQGQTLMSALLEEAGHTTVVAEDLGTVPPWVRASLAGLHVPGYKVFRWERLEDGTYIDPRSYPVLSIATTGTHDTETLVTWWHAIDADERGAALQCLGLEDASTSWPEVHHTLLERLYESGSALTILPIQDLFGWAERINLPGTVGPQNWTYRLPAPTRKLDRLPGITAQLERVRTLIEATGRGRRR
jgi:4-alpha-glucanotransferase